MLQSLASLSALLNLAVAISQHEESCGIYPRCSLYGQGTWQILEDCNKYIKCTIVNGEMIQENLQCPGDLVYANEYGQCVEFNMATECKVFKETACFYTCPRAYLQSTGPALQYQEQRLGCFRLSGTMMGVLAHYTNSNGQFLAPDATSSLIQIHWLIGEKYGGFNGGIRNSKLDYIRCPTTNWNIGWQVDKGSGIWVDDVTMTVTCVSGEDDVTNSTTQTPHPTDEATTTIPNTTPTPDPSGCSQEGPNMITTCNTKFNCCKLVSSSWQSTACQCKNDLVFSQDFGMCTWPDMEGCQPTQPTQPTQQFDNHMNRTRLEGWTGVDYECEGGISCD